MIYQSDLLKTHYKSQGKSNPKDSSSIKIHMQKDSIFQKNCDSKQIQVIK